MLHMSSIFTVLAAFVTLSLAPLTAVPARAATMPGAPNDGFPSVIYDYTSGEVLIDTEGNHTTFYTLDSLAGIFTGAPPVFVGGTIFTTDTNFRIREQFFTPSLNGVHNLGPVAQPYLSQAFLLSDLNMVGGRPGPPSFPFDLILRNTPEPSTIVLVGLGLVGLIAVAYRRSRAAWQPAEQR